MNDVKLFRKVLVFDTAKQSKVEFESSATIWGDLKKELSKYDIGTSNCKFIEGSTKLTLEQEQALVPTKDFVIFKMPVSTKSAAKVLTSGEYKEIIKAEIAKDATAKTFFSGYSSMKVDELAVIVRKYEAKVKKDQAKVAKVTTTAAPKVAAKPATKAKEPVKVEKIATKKAEKVVSTKSEKPTVAKKPTIKAETPEWMTLLQRCVDIAPAHIAESVNYIISKELEVPTITTDVAALAIMAKQLK